MVVSGSGAGSQQIRAGSHSSSGDRWLASPTPSPRRLLCENMCLAAVLRDTLQGALAASSPETRPGCPLQGGRCTRRWIAQAEPPPPVAVAWRPGEGAAPIPGADPSQERESLHAEGSPRPMNDGGTPGSAPRLGAAADLPWMNLSPGFPLGCPAVTE